VRPLSTLATRIGALQADRTGQRIEVPEQATSELVVIADALNDYLARNDRFVERERAFIDTTSHELRTPIAIIAGASGIALEQEGALGPARAQLLRINHTAREVERLIGLLLLLARDPARLSTISEPVDLGPLLRQIVESHRHLTREKDLLIELVETTPCSVVAPLAGVQAAVGNLLRNAIENSDRGTIHITLAAPATITISDPGHGMTAEEISTIYARVARGGGEREGGGIGLDLIARLCEHLGWSLALRSKPDFGTTAVLHFGRDAAVSPDPPD
jgi:signal transduction histidine kinase